MGWLTLARQARNHGHRPTRRRDMRRAGAGKWRDAGRRAQAGRAVARPRRRQSREEASRPLTSTITDPPHFPSRLEDPPPGPSTNHLIKPPPSPPARNGLRDNALPVPIPVPWPRAVGLHGSRWSRQHACPLRERRLRQSLPLSPTLIARDG